MFFNSADLDLAHAVPGTLALVPPAGMRDALRRDYAAMTGMIFGAVPSFDEILVAVEDVEPKVTVSCQAAYIAPLAHSDTMGRSFERGYVWQFKSRFRRHAFGWRGSRPAIQRIHEAIAEIKAVARTDPALAAEGAVVFLERLSPALEHIDSSSGAIGSAVNRAITDLVPIITAAPAERGQRETWLDRLWAALEADEIPYIETLADDWGDLCASTELASAWADRLVGTARVALSPDPNVGGYFRGTSACLSALFRAGRYDEIVDILRGETFWPYAQWAVRARVARGEKADAIRYAESCRGRSTNDAAIDRVCEEILLSSGLTDAAYERYGRSANRRGSYLATFRAIAKKYPDKPSAEILADLAADTPGEEGKWFAAAKDARLYDVALELARRSPCDPRTLVRAARDFAAREPAFAVEVGLLALHWIVEGHGYDITSSDVLDAFSHTMRAAEIGGTTAETSQRITMLRERDAPDGMVRRTLGRVLLSET